MTESINNLLTRILGKELGLRLRVYQPKNVSKDNKVVYSYIYGIDDVANGMEDEDDTQDTPKPNQELQPV